MPRKPKSGLVLAPGASANRNQATLVALDEAMTAEGVAVARMDFPYTIAGRRAPDKPPVLLDTVRRVASEFAAEAKVKPERIVFGGRSMGGRICSMAVAEGLPALGLALISYPLHPPGKPDKPRTEHLPALDVPCLFVSGTRDTFGTPDELLAATATIPGPVTHVWIEGGDHGLRGKDAQVVDAVRSWFSSLG